MSRIGRYHLFGSDNDPDLLPDLIVLDQNVCLHIKGFYFGESREYNEDLRDSYSPSRTQNSRLRLILLAGGPSKRTPGVVAETSMP